MRPATFLLRCGLALSLMGSTVARADIHVIVHPENSNYHLSQQQVANLYLGRARTFQSGEFALILDQSSESPIRERFFRQLLDMSLPQVNAYWARLTFTGRQTAPEALKGDKAVIEAVRGNPRSIGYVEQAPTDGSVRVVFRIRE